MIIKKLLLFFLLSISISASSASINELFSAAIFGKTERVKFLLSEGTDVNGVTGTGRTAMMAACFNGNVRVVRILLAYGANVNIVDSLGSTALMDAVVFGSEELVELLITAGADVTIKDKQNISVIEKAKKTKYDNIVKILEKSIATKEEKRATKENSESELTEGTKKPAEDSEDKSAETKE